MEGCFESLHFTWSEVITTALFIVYGLGISLLDTRWYFFIERDAMISQRANLQGQVSNTMLEIIAAVIPALALVCVTIGTASKCGRGAFPSTSSLLKLGFWLGIGLTQALGVALVAVNTLKLVTSRPRPGFFDICNYAGYSSALRSGNYSEYFAATTAGVAGDISKCLSPGLTKDALRSFPSGHAGLSFAGLGFLTLALRWAMVLPTRSWLSLRALLASCPLVLAAWVAITRVQDGKHFPIDITLGSAIGFGGALLAWRQFSSHPDRASAVPWQIVSRDESGLLDHSTQAVVPEGSAPGVGKSGINKTGGSVDGSGGASAAAQDWGVTSVGNPTAATHP